MKKSNGYDHSGFRNLKLTVSHKEINGINWFLLFWYKLRKAYSYLSSYEANCCQPIKLQRSLKCNISRKTWMMNLIFGMQINIEVFHKLIVSFCCVKPGMPKVPKMISLRISRKAWHMKLIFCLQINTKIFYKLIVSLWLCIARHARSTENNKFTKSLQYLKENVKDEADFCLLSKVSSKWYYHFRCVWPGTPKLPKIKSSLFFCNILRKKWLTKSIFCMQVSIKTYYKLILWFWWGWSSISKVPKIASLQCLHNISK